jgi:hypothetical protein
VAVGSSEVLVHNDCETWAKAFQRRQGGQIKKIVPMEGFRLGEYANNPEADWAYHVVVLKDGIVYDEFTPGGMEAQAWKRLWKYQDAYSLVFR